MPQPGLGGILNMEWKSTLPNHINLNWRTATPNQNCCTAAGCGRVVCCR